ncbi:MAG TPA: GAF domain-containing sensor histidine kinase [Victivallales bacterium]|nr:GAF domain-containing sensor histidine kinase [Victivallales bacterium]
MDEYYIYFLNPENLNTPSSLNKKEKEILALIKQKIASRQSLNELMNFLFENSPIPCDRLGLAFVDKDFSRVTAYWARSKNEKIFLQKGFWQGLSGTTLEKIIINNQIRVINDLEKYYSQNPESISTKLILKEGVKSSITCPLKVDNRNVGFLFISSYKKTEYNTKHIALYSTIAEYLSQIIEKVYLIEQLADQNHAYMEMLAFVSHEIKNPISSIIMDAEILIKGYLGEMETKQKEKLIKIKLKARYLLELTKNYLNLAKIETGKLSPQIKDNIKLKDLIEESISILEPQIIAKKMKIICEFRNNNTNISCDPELIKIVIINLIGNAVKYGYEEGNIKIIFDRQDNYVLLSVWNQGPGFTEEDKNKLFKKFSRLENNELMKQKGTGLGLYTAWQIINSHGGKISAESEHKKYAEFKIQIPLQRK